MALTEKPPRTVLRTGFPAAESGVAQRRSRQRDTPHKKRPVAKVAVIATAVFLVGFLSWFIYFRPLTVSAVAVETNVREQVYGLGVVGARVQSNVTFKVAGVLIALMADQGDRVRAGQVLATLDASDIEAQVGVAKAAVALARANIEKTKADIASAKTNLVNANAIAARRAVLIKQDSVSAEEAETRQADARVAAANLTSAQSLETVAEASLQSAEAQQAFEEATLEFYTLRAPYDAWVVSRNLELGSIVNSFNANQSVFTLVEARAVWAVGYVDERLAGRLSVGQPAEIVLRSHPDLRIPGHVERIEIQSDPVNEERLVDVAFDRIPDDVHLAEQAYVYITAGVLRRAILAPPSAVTDLRDGHGAVWTVESGRLERRRVRFGPELLDGRLPIVDGLPAGATVVATPAAGFRVGRAARISEASQR
jgi:HlyD family secretion protein